MGSRSAEAAHQSCVFRSALKMLCLVYISVLFCAFLPSISSRTIRNLPEESSLNYRTIHQPLEYKEKKYDRWGYGFGSDGYLYDFVKKSNLVKRARSTNPWGFGSDGYLYDFVGK